MEKTENDGATEKAVPVLSLSDICDCDCGSSAYVRVIFANSHFLDFCGHHYQKYKNMLEIIEHTVIDERDRLLDRSYALDVWTKGGINARNR